MLRTWTSSCGKWPTSTQGAITTTLRIPLCFLWSTYTSLLSTIAITMLIPITMTKTFREFPAPGRRRLELETSITCTDGSKRTVPRWRSTSSTSSMPSSLPLLSSPSLSSMMLSLSSATVYVIIASTIILTVIVAVISKSIAYHSHPPRPPCLHFQFHFLSHVESWPYWRWRHL